MAHGGDAAALIGSTIGAYRIVAELGGGAMGDVYYGEHVAIGRRAAIKILRPEFSVDEELVSRFVTEAKAVNEIRHPNIVDVTDFGAVSGRYYIVMELLEGETLEERLERSNRLPSPVAVRIASQVAAAVGAAHDRGIVHRDIKPENIFLTNHRDYPDYIKVLDFGIAKLTAAAVGTGLDKGGHQTIAGRVLGTPAYMSPEQCRGATNLDHRSDIYSLGVVLYEMCCGQRPFSTATIADLIVAHVREQPVAPLERNPDVAPTLSAAILRSLAKDPEDRFVDMNEFRAALDLACRESAPETPAGSREAIFAAAQRSPQSSRARAHSDPASIAGRERRDGRAVGLELTRIIVERIASNRLVLPSMPTTVTRAVALCQQETVNFSALAETIEGDPLIASQLLRVANSPAFLGATRAKTVQQAISRLGLDQLRVLLVEVSAHNIFQSRNRRLRSAFAGLWDHSLAVAGIARGLCDALRAPIDRGTAYVAGMLHDVGKPIAAALLLEVERMTARESRSRAGKRGLVASLDETTWLAIIDDSYRAVGAALAKHWNLPEEVVQAITQREYDHARRLSCANLVLFADALADRTHPSGMRGQPQAVEAAVRSGQRLFEMADQMVNDVVDSVRPAVEPTTAKRTPS